MKWLEKHYLVKLWVNSVTRFIAHKDRLDIRSPGFYDNTIKETLRSKDSEKYPVCLAYQNGKSVFTFISIIYIFAKKLTLQITNG